MKFIVMEERPISLAGPPAVIVELQIAGEWLSLVDGKAVGTYEIKKFQGIEVTNRKAKEVAAKAALRKLEAAIPGIKYKEGELPEEWLIWANENICRGVQCAAVLHILVSKGFKPHKNLPFMQRIGYGYYPNKNLHSFI
jgi:uncharacterized NAD-dependent epimerase/dehydratase family protein